LFLSAANGFLIFGTEQTDEIIDKKYLNGRKERRKKRD
jgi:hypothetical protein